MRIAGNQAPGVPFGWRPTAKKILLATALLAGPVVLAHANEEDIAKPEKGRLLSPVEVPFAKAPPILMKIFDVCKNQLGGKLNGPTTLTDSETGLKFDAYECAKPDRSPLDPKRVIADPKGRKQMLKEIGSVNRVVFFAPQIEGVEPPAIGNRGISI